ncbi:gliding motility lipoprotein GldD [uncultured Sunxiuqinia sp.]|uniref:gliding motility lipoprotein GldD n=1 Tax=uncultured Sunxiuqinia sp. TaxID=1573825 RepID=UPI002604682C|nr:gliding motility lipoprotein GldD [uncultured Sunxiuqinia sp.]
MQKQFSLIVLLVVLLSACQKEYTPKPRGYFRIEFPEKTYHRLGQNLPYSFEVADYSIPRSASDYTNTSDSGWLTISTPANKADLHLSYAPLNNDLQKHLEESRRLAYDHSIKADAIEERLFINREQHVYGTIYYIEGNAASPIQFFLTDSTEHFLRGALYIREIPNIDSIRPVIDFLEPDVIRLIETTHWN